MKKYSYLKLLCAIIIISVLMCINGEAIFAESRWIDSTNSTHLNLIVRDEVRDRIYLADSGNSKLVIIDSQSEAVTRSMSLPGNIMDMAISKDGSRLAVASAGSIIMVNLNTLRASKIKLPKELKGLVVAIAFDQNGHMFCLKGALTFTTKVVINLAWSLIYHLSASGDTLINKFGIGLSLNESVYCGILKTDISGTKLYVADRWRHNLTIHKIDISNPKKPVFLAKNQDKELGGNLRDFTISPRYDEVYLASGSPYGIQVVNGSTLRLITVLETGEYPCGVDVSRSGDKIYGIPADSGKNNYAYEFNAKDRTLLESYQLLSEVDKGAARARGIAVDRFAEKAFVVHGIDEYDESSKTGQMKVQVVDVSGSGD